MFFSKLAFLAAIVLCPFAAYAEWQPATDQNRYADVLKRVAEGEGYTRFFQMEKALIGEPVDAYLEARWTYLRQVDRAPVATPPVQQIDAFVNACRQAGWLTPEEIPAFRKAVICLGKELITDKSPFQVTLENVREIRGIPYASYDGYHPKLDLFLPSNPGGKPMPCIIYIHCGGWSVHKRAWFEGHARLAAREGFIAANIDYRLLPGVSPVDCLHDAKAAVRFIRANAARYGIDPDRIGACGASAGAQLTAALATTADQSALEGAGGNAGVSSHISAGVCFATPAMTGRHTWPLENTKEGLPDWFKTVSPYEHASKGDAPMKFIHGTADALVSVEEPKDLKAKLDSIGVICDIELIPNAGHVCYMSEAMGLKAIEYFRQIMK